jgi:hypothetical protein
MTDTAISPVRNAFPPPAIGLALTPAVRLLVQSPIGRFIDPFAILELTGRHTGRRRRVVVGWHEIGGSPVLFTPAPWRANLADGPVEVSVRHRGRTQRWCATLERDPATVARLLQTLFENGMKPRDVSLHIPPNHNLTAADVETVDRAAIHLSPI